MITTRICLVRHGETDWNVERRIQGHLDVDLNDTGIAQAEAVNRALAGESFAAVYSSDLTRAKRTAEIAARHLPVCITPGLRERHYGTFQGRTYAEGKVRQPLDYERFCARDLNFSFGTGESLSRFARRITEYMEALAGKHRGEQILAVTHGGVLDVIYRMATAMPLSAARNFGIPNAGLNWIAHDERGWQVIRWADESHLRSSLDELSG